MTLDTELSHVTALEQLGIRRAVRIMTRRAAFDHQRRMLEDERALLVGMALEATGVCSCRQSCLLWLEAAVRIMARIIKP